MCAQQKGVVYSIAAVPNATSYTWAVPSGYLSDGVKKTRRNITTTSPTVTADFGSKSGYLTVIAKNTCGSGAQATKAVAFTCREAVLTPENEFALSAYPNPASENLTISIESDGDHQVALSIVDMTGRIVWSKDENAVEGVNTYQVDITEFAGGIYLVRGSLKDEAEEQTMRIIVK